MIHVKDMNKKQTNISSLQPKLWDTCGPRPRRKLYQNSGRRRTSGIGGIHLSKSDSIKLLSGSGAIDKSTAEKSDDTFVGL